LTAKKTVLSFIDLIFPCVCIGCEKEGMWLCARCFDSIPITLANHCPFCEKKTLFGNTCEDCKNIHFLDGAISATAYSNELILSMIHCWKYNSIKQMTPYLGEFVSKSIIYAQRRIKINTQKFIEQGVQKNDIKFFDSIPAILTNMEIDLQPIPLHPKKEKQRGFNQAYVLAKHIARNFKTFNLADFLERTKKTTAQATLSGTDRSVNMNNAFKLRSELSNKIIKKHIVLVDDVITTASTTDECALLLKNAGASSVWALTIAYGHPIKEK